MNALELADAVEPLVLTSFHETQYIGRKAADMLRKQHEAIKQLRGALADTAQNLVWMQWGDCRKFLTQGPMITVHEAVAIAEQALKDTEHLR